MPSLADRPFDLRLGDRVRFGVGAIGTLPDLIDEVGDADDRQAFIVTDSGVVAAGVIDRVAAILGAVGARVHVYADVEPNPGTTSILRGSAALAAFGVERTILVPVGGGSSMDTAKAISLHAVNGGDVLALGYHREDLRPGRPLIAVPTTAGTGAETNTYGVITDEAAVRKDYVGHPSVRPAWTILDPALTIGLPSAATAATGVDALTHAIEALLSRNPNPYAEALALEAIHLVGAFLPRAVADGTDLEARSQLLVASHLAGEAQVSGPGSGLVHALGHAIGTRGRLPHGLSLAVILPEVLAFYAAQDGLRDRELKRIGVALGAASPTETDPTGAIGAIGAVRNLLTTVGLRPRLGALGFDDPKLDLVAEDAIADAAIRNAPRLPTREQARELLASVLD